MITKKETIEVLVKGLEKSKKEVELFMDEVDRAIEILFETMEVTEKEKESKTKLGKYILVSKKIIDEKEGRNPSSGETITIPRHIEMNVKRTKCLKDLK